MVMVLPIYEEDGTGIYYNTSVLVDADGTILGKYRKHHLPHLDKFWEKFYFRPGNLGYPVFDTAVGRIGMYICYDRHFPEGWRELGLNNAHMVFNPNATKPGLSNRLWEVEGPCAAVANGYFVLQPNRVGLEDIRCRDRDAIVVDEEIVAAGNASALAARTQLAHHAAEHRSWLGFLIFQLCAKDCG